MFEIGLRMKAERGAENVFDFTLGNPDVEPPEAVVRQLRAAVDEYIPRIHGYMPNAGFPNVRERVAQMLSKATGLGYAAEDIIMTVGAAGALNIFFRAVLDPGDEVIVLAPFFSEYEFYVGNHGGRIVRVETREDFQPDIDRILAAVTPRTRAILINTPNNPTGAVYGAGTLAELGRRIPEDITVVSDEPYRPVVFDGVVPPQVASLIPNSVVAWSWSKAMAIAGERIGYLALSPRIPDLAGMRAGCVFANRALGYINAPALWQRVVAAVPEATIDISQYAERRDLLCNALAGMGYETPRPQGSYYVFPKTPIPDDLAFIKLLEAESILAVPGIGFGRSGHMRLSLTIPTPMIERSLPGFDRARKKALGL